MAKNPYHVTELLEAEECFPRKKGCRFPPADHFADKESAIQGAVRKGGRDTRTGTAPNTSGKVRFHVTRGLEAKECGATKVRCQYNPRDHFHTLPEAENEVLRRGGVVNGKKAATPVKVQKPEVQERQQAVQEYRSLLLQFGQVCQKRNASLHSLFEDIDVKEAPADVPYREIHREHVKAMTRVVKRAMRAEILDDEGKSRLRKLVEGYSTTAATAPDVKRLKEVERLSKTAVQNIGTAITQAKAAEKSKPAEAPARVQASEPSEETVPEAKALTPMEESLKGILEGRNVELGKCYDYVDVDKFVSLRSTVKNHLERTRQVLEAANTKGDLEEGGYSELSDLLADLEEQYPDALEAGELGLKAINEGTNALTFLLCDQISKAKSRMSETPAGDVAPEALKDISGKLRSEILGRNNELNAVYGYTEKQTSGTLKAEISDHIVLIERVNKDASGRGHLDAETAEELHNACGEMRNFAKDSEVDEDYLESIGAGSLMFTETLLEAVRQGKLKSETPEAPTAQENTSSVEYTEKDLKAQEGIVAAAIQRYGIITQIFGTTAPANPSTVEEAISGQIELLSRVLSEHAAQGNVIPEHKEILTADIAELTGMSRKTPHTEEGLGGLDRGLVNTINKFDMVVKQGKQAKANSEQEELNRREGEKAQREAGTPVGAEKKRVRDSVRESNEVLSFHYWTKEAPKYVHFTPQMQGHAVYVRRVISQAFEKGHFTESQVEELNSKLVELEQSIATEAASENPTVADIDNLNTLSEGIVREVSNIIRKGKAADEANRLYT